MTSYLQKEYRYRQDRYRRQISARWLRVAGGSNQSLLLKASRQIEAAFCTAVLAVNGGSEGRFIFQFLYVRAKTKKGRD